MAESDSFHEVDQKGERGRGDEGEKSSADDGTSSKPASRAASSRSVVGERSSVQSVVSSSDVTLSPAKDDDKRRRNCFVQTVSGMWASTDMLKGHSSVDRQLFVKTTLRELILYSLFLAIMSYATFAHQTPMNNKLNQLFKSLFNKQMSVSNVEGFWKFVETDLMDGIYWETLYNKGHRWATVKCPNSQEPATKPCPVPPSDRNIMYENKVLGLPRIRQLKVHNSSCSIPRDFSGAIKVCFSSYSSAVEEKLPFPPVFRKYSSEEAWTYRTAGELGGAADYRGQFSTYSGAGYAQNFHYLKNETQAIVTELKRGLWITQGTRFLTIDFTVYNANINAFGIIQLTFEFPPTGGAKPYQTVRTFTLIKYVERSDYFLMACEFIFVLFILYYAVEEAIEIKMHKFAYFKTTSNLLDVALIGLSVCQIALNLYMFLNVEELLEEPLSKPFQHSDFSSVADLNSTLSVIAAFNIFVAWSRLYKYLSFSKTMTQFTGTLSAASNDLAGFCVMFFTIFFAFSQLGYLLFGTQIRGFSTFIMSCYTLFRMILGDFSLKAIKDANPQLGTIYFMSYIFFVYFVLLNMFLAIINDTYAEIKENGENGKPDFEVADFFKAGINNAKGHVGIHDRGVDVENAIKLAALDDGFVTYDELRENLRKTRFSDVEIDLLFNKFKNDPVVSQLILDEEEVPRDGRAMSTLAANIAWGMSDSMRQRKSSAFVRGDSADELDLDGATNLRPATGKQARHLRSAKIVADALKEEPVPDALQEEPVTDSEFYEMCRRVDKLESSILPLAHNLDVALNRLDGVFKERKLKKKDMEKIFDSILLYDDVTRRRTSTIHFLSQL